MSDFACSTEKTEDSSRGTAEAESGRPPAQAWPASQGDVAAKVPTLRSRIADAETQAILGALKNTDWNRKQAARLLAISYRGLLYKIRRHNIVRAK